MNILAYIFALPVILLIYTIALMSLTFATTPVARLRRDIPSLSIGLNFVISLLSAGVGVLGFIGLCKLIGAIPSFFMIFVPLLAFGLNDLSRINQASAGTSRVARMLQAEGAEYDAKISVRTNTAAMLGHHIAFLGIPLFVGLPFW